jgi:predicted nucleotide-binding protein
MKKYIDLLRALRKDYRKVIDELDERIKIGEQIKKRKIDSATRLKSTEKKFNEWNHQNYELLLHLFKSKDVAADYAQSEFDISRMLLSNLTVAEKRTKLIHNIEEKINKLTSIQTSLEVLGSSKEKHAATKVFFIHEKDSQLIDSILEMLREYEVEPIVLKELANAGKTLIDTIENAHQVEYAIAVVSPCDSSFLDKFRSLHPPSLNVILELGIFIGKYGRQKVSALYEKNVCLPADYHGFDYILLDETNSWKERLLQQMAEAEIVSIEE